MPRTERCAAERQSAVGPGQYHRSRARAGRRRQGHHAGRSRVRHRGDREQPPGRRREGEGAHPRGEGVRRRRGQVPEARQPQRCTRGRSTTRRTTTRTVRRGRTASTASSSSSRRASGSSSREFSREEGVAFVVGRPSTSRAPTSWRARDADAFKFASGDLSNVPLLRYVARVRQADVPVDRRRDARGRRSRGRRDPRR